MCLAPQSVCHTERLNADLSPPCCFVPTSMQFAMMSTAQWDSELITHLRPLYLPRPCSTGAHRPRRSASRCRRFPTDDPARARHPQLHAGAAPLHPWHGELDPIQYDRSARTPPALALSARPHGRPCLRHALVTVGHAPVACLLSRARARLFEFADGRLSRSQLDAWPCGRRLDELAHPGLDPRLDVAPSVRPARRICRTALSGSQAPAVHHQSNAHTG